MTFIENIIWEKKPEPGIYTVWVTNYNGSAQADFHIEVNNNGQIRTFGQYLPATLGYNSYKFTIEVTP